MTYWPGPGYRMAAAAHGDVRASDQDRERAAEVLKTGFAEGRLDKDEYDQYLSRIYAARTVGELATLTSQLPGGGATLLPVPAGPPRTNPMAVASMICGVAEFFTFGLTSIPAVILGHMARGADPADRRSRRRAGYDRAHPGLAGDHLVAAVLGWRAGGRGSPGRARDDVRPPPGPRRPASPAAGPLAARRRR